MATYMEFAGAYKAALYMWIRFLKIQEKMYGEPRAPLINSFKKIAKVYTAIGEPGQAMLYFEQAEKLTEELTKKGEITVDQTEKTDE